ncbi:MAG: RDD family protein [Treponema sp.]|jgi:uncharacterized RDD family membrane protein YckC|nr:RDD family protein [Treponema sp.]
MFSSQALSPLDSGMTVESPEGIEFTLFPAGPLIRSCAWAVDQLIQWTLFIIISVTSTFFKGEGGSWMMLLLFFCIDWFYHTLWEIFCRGQSPGKLLLGIRVLRGDGSPVNPGASFLRNLLRFADTFLFLCPVALTSMLLSKGFRRLGDWTAGTVVVYTIQSLAVSSFPGPVSAAQGFRVPAGGGGSLSGEEKQGILMFLRRYPLLGRARADEIAAPLVKTLRTEDGQEPEDSPVPGGDADYLLDIGKRILGD